LGNAPQWPNKHILLPLIKDKWIVLEETHYLKALVKWVTEFHQVRLEACQCTKEFILWRIRALSHREKLAFEYL
jgi:hypothetical protein